MAAGYTMTHTITYRPNKTKATAETMTTLHSICSCTAVLHVFSVEQFTSA